MTDPSAALDNSASRGGFADVVAEIEAETQRRRANGEYSPELLERLDAEFDRFAPLTFRRTGIDGAIRAVESAAFIDVEPPTASSRRWASAVKGIIKKATGWYHLHVAQQVTALGIQITRPLRMLHERTEELAQRLSDLEQSIGLASPENMAAIESLARGSLEDEVAEAIVSAIGAFDGRTAVIGETAEPVVRALVTSGHDAYGVSPRGGGGLDLEIRAEDPLGHLRSLATASLAGVVLVADPDTASTQARVEAARLAVDRVVPGGRIVVVTAETEAWTNQHGPVAADLVQSRPFHTDTWLYLLERFGARAPRLEVSVVGQRIIVASAS